ncbi:hypothetical protein CO005_03655 [Candidatus Roizmanbacteria bacterium CG_4_8_14_3_um_filter_34_9]|uniref:AbiEi antitoxin C-terminal domain-containing protein n=3 Tax=Candidatus Roizmaniibacteriota TaxID=1752723 RepID=A0A2M7AVL6_9BACT|nr:MAG: hypothetical protein COT02_00525 [Candidatus Roizmanbacteria bacterium CG07_land_8_20_14_0_80_34_15]PIU74593.1 MAG: hypothetical protein COS77_00640 [Candidatus Roizmanbacteria bacterium CG06_land_8_20_14_3_00_34_14]PIW73031.1 MAG: hypothetical protein CO005_03655 [Candidatus Roizmanbacteria bacterium CG_4_8_14_3_um_filter_34_9]
METYSTTDIIKIMREREMSTFSLDDFGRLLNINNQNSLYKKIQRLEKKEIIKKLIKGKYLFIFNKTDDFKIANYIYQPSYISLESALSFYGIITGFSYKITSITVKKSRSYIIDEKDYLYSHINQDLFWGYEKKEDFLIAEKEKALVDLIYFYSKGLRGFDREDLDISEINKKKLILYAKKFNNKKTLSIIKNEIL